MSRSAENVRRRVETYQQQVKGYLADGASLSVLQEAFTNIVNDLLRIEDEGWILLSNLRDEEKGFSLEDIIKVTKYLEQNVKTNNLLGRGLRLRNNHVFGRGFTIEATEGKIAPRYQAIVDDPENQEVIYSPVAMRELNRILFTSGNLIVMYDKKAKKFERLSVDMNIGNYLSYDNNPSRIKYFLRTWETRDDLSTGAMPVEHKEWVPTHTYAKANPRGIPKSIVVGSETIPVAQDRVAIDLRINRDNGEIWGVPDAFSAAPWAWAANNSYKNGTKLWDAQAAIAMIVKAQTQLAQQQAGAKLQRNKVGQAAIHGPDTEIKELPKNNMVDLYDLRPLVAQVALALDVSVSALAADVGKGGARAAEQTLEGPELLAALSRQEEFSEFLAKCFDAMGMTNAHLNWNRLDADPIHRVAQTASLFRVNGGINQEEYRVLGLELLDIQPTTTEMPKPDEFTGAKTTDPDAGLETDPDPDETVGPLNDPNSSRDGDLDA